MSENFFLSNTSIKCWHDISPISWYSYSLVPVGINNLTEVLNCISIPFSSAEVGLSMFEQTAAPNTCFVAIKSLVSSLFSKTQLD